MRHPFFEVERPVVIGHRGSAGTHPENTLASFAAALAAGAQILESDIQLTRDGVPVLLHDPEVDRVTEATGAASDFELVELRSLNAAHRFMQRNPDAHMPDETYAIPTLEEAFASFPDARFNLEIKSADPRAIATTLDLIEGFDRSDRTLLAAESDEIMCAVRAALELHAASPALSASIGEVVASIDAAIGGKPMPEGVMALQIPPHFGDDALVTPELIAHAHAHHVDVHVWTINAVDEIERLLKLGVDGIVTDHPGRMRDWLSRRGQN